MEKTVPSSHGIHLLLTTLPQQDECHFHANMVERVFNDYKDQRKRYLEENPKLPDCLYTPKSYFLLGNYDIAYISLIDDLKFTHRLMEPYQAVIQGEERIYAPHASQSLFGYSVSAFEDDERVFSSVRGPMNEKYYLGICNLKINNGILIGNSSDLFDEIYKLILYEIDAHRALSAPEFDKGVQILVSRAVAWFEISVVLFSNSIDSLFRIIKSIRRLKVNQMYNSEMFMAKSLYGLDEKVDKEVFGKCSIFSDTHTYFGINSDLIINSKQLDSSEPDESIKEFRRKFEIEAKGHHLRTIIEWQIKPGHFHLHIHDLSKDKILSPIFDFEKKSILTGKSDYTITCKSDLVINNVLLFRHVINSSKEIFQHARRIRTRVHFFDKEEIGKPDRDQYLTLENVFRSLNYKPKEISDISTSLKTLKVSRQIRRKVIKIFINYNSGIQDHILFTYFIDFRLFIDNLKTMIEAAEKDLLEWRRQAFDQSYKNELAQISKFEMWLTHRIDVFQEAYGIRILNGYQFEDIIDFDLDFNTSVQQIVSAYSALADGLGNQMKGFEATPQSHIVLISYKDTSANSIAINYSLHHLTSPEFVYATLSKEIFNGLQEMSRQWKSAIDFFKNDRDHFLNFVNIKLFDEMYDQELFDLDYLQNDILRYAISFNLNFELFYFWFWSFNFQNSGLFERTGNFDEEHFKKELLRIMLLAKIFDKSELLTCPLPELKHYWRRYFNKMELISQRIIGYLTNTKILVDAEISYLNLIDGLLVQFWKISSNEIKLVGTDEYRSDIASKLSAKPIKYKLSSEVRINDVLELSDRYLFMEDSDNYGSANTELLFQRRIYQHLKLLYSLPKGRISIIKRNWIDGLPCETEANITQVSYTQADQMGGVFFTNNKRLWEYFEYSQNEIFKILDYSSEQKLKFIRKRLTI